MKAPHPGERPTFLSSLRWRLPIAIIAVVVLCTATSLIGARIFLSSALKDRATSDLRRTLTGVSGYFDNQRSDLIGAANLVAADPVVGTAVRKDDRQALIVHLDPFYGDLNTDVLDVIDARGRVVVRMEDTQTGIDNIRNRPSIRKALAGGEVVAFETDLPNREAAGGYALRATVSIRNGAKVIGAVVVGRQLDSIFAARIGHAVDAGVNLIAGGRRTGTTVTDSHGLPTTGVVEPAGLLQRISTGRTSIDSIQEDGRSVLSGVIPLAGDNGQWIGAVEVVSPLDPVNDVITSLSYLLLALGAGVVVVGTVLALNVSRRLTSRIDVLEGTASRVASMAGEEVPLGDLRITPAVQGNDELTSLARSFSAMMVALDDRIAANTALCAAAQERVRELTGLAEIARLLTAVSSVHETMDMLGQHVCRLVGCSGVAIWLPGEGALPALYGGHGLPERYETVTGEVVCELSDSGFETVPQSALRTGQVAHASLDDELPAEVASCRMNLRATLHAAGFRGATAVPLCLQNRIVGALTCYTSSNTALSGSDLGLLTTIADQVAVAVENARLYMQSRDIAALEERQRLARELHDSVSQALYGIALGTQTAMSLLEQNPGQAAESLKYVLTQAEAGLTEMRALIFELRPEALEAEGLVVALQKQAESLRARHGIVVKAHLGNEPDVPFPIKESIYRIAQEALHNAVKHAHPHSVEMRLIWDAEGIELEIRDDGSGFNPDVSFPGHLGLRTLKERAMRLGGSLILETAPGHGTRIGVKAPYLVQSRNGDVPAASI